MSRSDDVYLQDILDAIDIILSYVDNKTESAFVNDQMLQDAVIRRFEIIGEASTKISEDIKDKNPGVQWRLMKGDEKQAHSRVFWRISHYYLFNH